MIPLPLTTSIILVKSKTLRSGFDGVSIHNNLVFLLIAFSISLRSEQSTKLELIPDVLLRIVSNKRYVPPYKSLHATK